MASLVLASALSVFAQSALPAAEPPPPRPNVLLITMDQLAYDWVRSLGPGFPLVDTPAIDSLVAAGVAFRRHYSENEVCHPSRCTILTGRPPICHGALDNNMVLPESELTWAEILQGLGYRTGAFGKIHTQAEGAWQGFETAVDNDQIVAWLEARGVFLDQLITWLDSAHGTGVLHVDYGHHPETVIADLAMGFMEQAGDDSWFAYVSFNNPHPPSLPMGDSWSGVDPLDVPILLPQPQDFVDKPPFTIQRVRNLALDKLRPDQSRMHYGAYAAMIEETDRQIGRLLRWVDLNARDRNTIVVFTSDHGDMAGQLGLFDKLFGPYESAIRVPAVVAMPGVLPAGATVDSFTQHADLLPTVLELIGVRAPAPVLGSSLVDLARGGPPIRQYVLSGREMGDVSYQISDGRFSLILHPGAENELYDLQADPGQVVNRIHDPGLVSERDRLYDEWVRLRAEACR